MACRRAAGLARRSSVSYFSYGNSVRRGGGSGLDRPAVSSGSGAFSSSGKSSLQIGSLASSSCCQLDLHQHGNSATYMTDCSSRISWNLTSVVAFPNQFNAGFSHVSRAYSSSSDLPPHQEIGMPSLSPTMTQGNIASWKKKEGDQVAAGDVLCEIETDKATLEMESMEEGYLAKILVGDDAKDIPVGQAICIMVEDKDSIGKFSDYKGSGGGGGAPKAAVPKEEASTPPPAPPSSEPSSSSPPPPPPKPSAPPSSRGQIFASPAAKKLAAEKNVPLSSIRGTGPDGNILKADIEDYLASGASPAKQQAHAPPETAAAQQVPLVGGLDYKDIPNSQIKRVTARRLLQSKQTIPHYYLSLDTRVDSLLALRVQLNQAQESAKRKKLSLNDFVIKAAALASKKVPECNSSWTDDFIRQYHNINISVAVQTEHGLMVPVVKDADKKGLSAISEDVKVLADKARTNTLKPSDYEGGTFTITNLGGPFGIKQFCAIINPPQSCILAVGTTEKRVIAGPEKGEFLPATFMTVTLSCDHRVVDGAIGAQWLGAFKGYIEDPMTLLL